MKQTFFFLILIATLCTHALGQGGGAVGASEPRIHFVRSVSGSEGTEQNGRYIVSDPRSTFYIPADKKVIVYFEWEGPAGKHHFEGYWKNPEGKVVVMSDFSFEARQKRFGGYWILNLTEDTKPGMWALEAHVDGEMTGTHTFQIVSSEKPTDLATSRPLLAPSEVYKQAVAAAVTIENLDDRGQRVSTGSGFFLANGLVVTAFQVIDGASALRVVLPSHQAVQTNEVAAWNRLQDWAVLKVGSDAPAKLQPARAKSWSVGDRCFTLDVPTEGNRVIVDESITGTNSFPEFGDRFNLSSISTPPATGSPVLNEYGDVIGVLGGSVFPGARRMDNGAFTVTGLREGAMATPIELVSVPAGDNGPKSLSDLNAMGLFVTPVIKSEVLYGLLGEHLDLKKNEFSTSLETKSEFSRSNGHCEVAVVWNPRSKLRGEVTMMIYDINNHPVVGSKPLKLKGSAGQYMASQWQIELGNLRPSTYRIDVLQDAKPVWRSFFKITN